MTKKIAVIGCSFSAFWQGDDTCQGPNKDVKTWSNLLSENFDVQIDSYAQNGNSCGYVFYCLNHILNKDKKYDLIIGNVPPLNRDWYFSWNDYNDEDDYNKLYEYDSWFTQVELSDNVTQFFSDVPVTTHSHDNVSYVQYSGKPLEEYKHDYLKNFTNHISNNFLVNQRKNLQMVQLMREFYTKQLPLIFWHHVDNMFMVDTKKTKIKTDAQKMNNSVQHNISHTDLSVIEYFRNLVGKNIVKQKYLIDPSHFTNYGHEQLLEKYILRDNKISKILIP